MAWMSRACLPPNSTALERASADAAAVEIDTVALRRLESARLAPVHTLPWLAWERHVDDWSDDWSEAARRMAVERSIQLHRLKGTVWAVKESLAITGYRTHVREWWQQVPAGVPHTFLIEVEIDDRGLDDAALDEIERRIESAKPVRSHFGLRAAGTSRATVSAGCFVLAGDVISISPYQLTELTIPAMTTVPAAAGHDWGITTVLPRKT